MCANKKCIYIICVCVLPKCLHFLRYVHMHIFIYFSYTHSIIHTVMLNHTVNQHQHKYMSYKYIIMQDNTPTASHSGTIDKFVRHLLAL